jgi:Cu(I)/Ag(I) efflux system protein CusF
MPAMTMVFQVKDPAMLDQLKAGDKIRFSAEKLNGELTVTKIEPRKLTSRRGSFVGLVGTKL